MKLNFQTFLVCFLLVIQVIHVKTSCAQTEFGVKAGALYSNFNKESNSSVFQFNRSSGFNAGVFMRRSNLLGPVGFQAELLYQLKSVTMLTEGQNSHSQQGYPYGYSPYGYGYSPYGYGYSSYGYGYPSYSYSYDYVMPETTPWLVHKKNLHYLSLPLSIMVSPCKIVDFYAGTEVNFLFAASGDFIERNEYSQVTFGLIGGANIKLGENTRLDLRYSRDLTNTADWGSLQPKMRSFSVSVQQVLFRGKKKN